MVGIFAVLSTNTSGDGALAGFAVSGASTIAANDAQAVGWSSTTVVGGGLQVGALFLVTGLTPGSNTFTMKYRAVGGRLGSFANRTIVAWPANNLS